MIRFNKINTFLAGKVTLYMLNAVTDAYLAQELYKHSQNKDKEISNNRLKKLLAGVDISDKQYILGLATCEYFFNGFYDVMYSRLIMKFIISKDKKRFLKLYNNLQDKLISNLNLKNYYKEFPKEKIILIKPTFNILLGKIPFQEIIKRKWEIKKINKQKFIAAFIEVQNQNIKNNNKYIRILKKNKETKEPKIIYLRKFSKNFSKSEYFLKSTIKTLNSANRWDKLFAWYLRLVN